MNASFTPIFVGIFALAGLSLASCSSSNGGATPGTGSGGSEGGTVTASGGVSGGATTTPASSGGTVPSGGTPATGGQTQAQASSTAQGGSTVASTATSAAGQTATGGSTTGGKTAGGSASGGSVIGGSVAGGANTGGVPSGGASASSGGTGGRTSSGGAAGGSIGTTGGAGTGGKTTTGGSASGGAATGGTTVVPPIGGGLGSSDGKTPIKVWLAGDSTMADGAGCSASGCPCGYGTQLDPLFNSNVTVVNNAVGGLTIQTWLYQGVSSTMVDGECAVTNTAFQSRWTNMLSGASAMKAGDYLFISFGINDGDGSCPKHVGEAKYLGYLNLMVKAAKDLGVEPILMPPVGAIDCGGGSTAVNIRSAYFTTATNDAGTANNVPVIDLGALSVALYNSLGLCPNSADYTSTTSKVGQFFCQDHTHFQLSGAKQIAQVIVKALKDQGIGLGAYVLN
jgi:lysophospholipase L1-like esterase